MSLQEALEQHQPSVCPPRHSPGPGRHLHAGVEGWLTLKVVHDDAVVAVDDVLVDALPPEVLQNLVDAVNTVQDGLEEEEEENDRGGEREEEEKYCIIISIISYYWLLCCTNMFIHVFHPFNFCTCTFQKMSTFSRGNLLFVTSQRATPPHCSPPPSPGRRWLRPLRDIPSFNGNTAA